MIESGCVRGDALEKIKVEWGLGFKSWNFEEKSRKENEELLKEKKRSKSQNSYLHFRRTA